MITEIHVSAFLIIYFAEETIDNGHSWSTMCNRKLYILPVAS